MEFPDGSKHMATLILVLVVTKIKLNREGNIPVTI